VVPIQEIGGPNPRNRAGPIRGNQVVPIQEIDWSQSEEIPQATGCRPGLEFLTMALDGRLAQLPFNTISLAE